MFARAYTKATSRMLLRKSSAALDDQPLPRHGDPPGANSDVNSKLRLHLESVYKPVDPQKHEIRVLQIFPRTHFLGLDVDVVRCRIKKVSLQKKPVFEAISWAHNASLQDAEIELNGRLIPISPGIRDLAKRLRSDTMTRSFWIESLCIKQSDESEVEYHAHLMKDILSGAKGISIWLGAASRYTDVAMSNLRDIAASAKTFYGGGATTSHLAGEMALACVVAILQQNPVPLSNVLVPLEDFFGCAYWGEQTMLEKLAESPTRVNILYGEGSISSESLSKAILMLNASMAYLHEIRQRRQLGPLESRLLELSCSPALAIASDELTVNMRGIRSSQDANQGSP